MIMIPCAVQGFVRVTDPATGEILVDKKNDIHYDNMRIFDPATQKTYVEGRA